MTIRSFCPCCLVADRQIEGDVAMVSRRRFLSLSGSGLAAMGLGTTLAAALNPGCAQAYSASDTIDDVPSWARGGDNPSWTPPHSIVSVTATIAPVQYDFTPSVPELQRISMSYPGRSTPRNCYVMGLSYSDLTVVPVKMETEAQPCEGGWQGKVASIALDFRITHNMIYISRELQDTCGHGQVLRHEETHKEIERTLIAEFQNSAAEDWGEIVTQIGFVRAPDKSSVDRMLTQQYRRCLESYSDRLFTTLNARQLAFDSPAEYGRIAKSCSGQIESILRTALIGQ